MIVNSPLARSAALALLLCVCPGVQADLTDLPLEQLLATQVITASRFVQTSREAPSGVSVLTDADIRAHGWRTLAEALDHVRGVLITDDRAYSYLGPRGIMRPGEAYNSHILLLVDGVRVNDNIYNQAFLGEDFPIDLELVKRIEYVPGPGSAVYGSHACLAVVNVITHSAAGLAGGRAHLTAGSQGLRRGQASLGGSVGQAAWVLAASGLRSRGEDIYFPEFGGVADDLDGERAHRLYAKLEVGRLSLTGVLSEREKALPTAPFDSHFNDPRTRYQDGYRQLVVAHTHDIRPDLSLYTRLDWGEYRFVGDLPEATPPHDLLQGRTLGRWLGLEARLQDNRMAGHRWIYALDYRRDLRQHMQETNLASGASIADVRESGWQWGVSVQDEWRLSPEWILNAGLRYDRYTSFGGTANPRLALIHAWSPRTTFKYLYGRAYRAPNVYELSFVDSASKANPALRPERIETFEALVEHETTGGWQWTTGVFHNRLYDLIVQQEDTDGLNVYRNVGDNTATGLEAQVGRQWPGGARAQASLLWQRALDQQGQRLAYTPAMLAKASLSMPLSDWRLTLQGKYVGERRARSRSAGGYARFDLALSRRWGQVDVLLRINNLLDRHYADPVSDPPFVQETIPGRGRLWLLRLGWSF